MADRPAGKKSASKEGVDVASEPVDGDDDATDAPRDEDAHGSGRGRPRVEPRNEGVDADDLDTRERRQKSERKAAGPSTDVERIRDDDVVVETRSASGESDIAPTEPA